MNDSSGIESTCPLPERLGFVGLEEGSRVRSVVRCLVGSWGGVLSGSNDWGLLRGARGSNKG